MIDHGRELQKLATELQRVRRDLGDLPRRLEQRERSIRGDENLTAEMRKIRLRQVREEEQAKQQKLHRRRTEISEEMARSITQGRVGRPVDEMARARVRDLLDRGLSHSQVLDQAVKLNDDDTVEALRWEAMYHGTSDGFADGSDTVEACDRALARIGRGGQRAVAQAIVRAQKTARGIDEIDRFAAKAVHGSITPFDRLSFGHAVSGDGSDA